MQVSIKDIAALYTAYIPVFAMGGIFIPTTRNFMLGEEMYVLLALPEDAARYPIAGFVAWITPANSGARAQGVGIRFPDDAKSRALKTKIEHLLGAHLTSDAKTQTL